MKARETTHCKKFQSVYPDQNNHKIGLTGRMNSYESIAVFLSPEVNKTLTFRCQHTDDFNSRGLTPYSAQKPFCVPLFAFVGNTSDL